MAITKKFIFLIIFTTLGLINASNALNGDKKQDAKCLLPMEPGPCRMSLNRFYYNAKTDSCEEFKFGGCKGNDNKFGFKQTCEAACKRQTNLASAATLVNSKTAATFTPTIKPLIAGTTSKTPTSAPKLETVAVGTQSAKRL